MNMARACVTELRLTLLVALVAAAAAQQACTPSTAVLQLASTDCTDVALKDCLSKLQLSVSPYCSVALQPSMPVALDGSYCERQRGVQARGAIAGKYSKGRSDLEFTVANAGGAISLAMQGRIVPDAGGRETQADCSLTYKVTAGSVLGVISQGTDTLVSSYTNGANIANGSGAAIGGAGPSGLLPGNTAMGLGLPGQQQQLGGMPTQQQQQQQGMMPAGGTAVPGMSGTAPAATSAAGRAVQGGMLIATLLAVLLVVA